MFKRLAPVGFLFAAAASIASGGAFAQEGQPSLSQALPVDTSVRIGTLPNGLRYYIRRNLKPEKRAELRLVVNAGSILETDDQLGLAHVIEHMAFEGTTHFGHTQLLSYLQSIGVRFGADLNAQTGFDETIYILPIPTDTARIVDQAFTILDDWAHGQLFDSAALNVERNVVLEEWRGNKGADDRMLHEWLPIAFRGSLYAKRLPIGTEQSIVTATPSRLRPFYDAWYRPDLMAVIAVGDFDPAQIEALITSRFSGLKNPTNERPRTLAPVPDNAAPLIAIATDKEATGSSVELSFKVPRQRDSTVGDYRRDLVEQLYLAMLNARFAEIAQKPDAPFLDAGASFGSFGARTIDAFTLGADVKDGGIDQGIDALILETRRAELGFLDAELARAKDDLLRGLEQADAERSKTVSAAYVGSYIANFLTRAAIPGIDYRYRMAKALV
ncbi:MAG TPA: pitrilysin family protein, partial [Gemmatimonadaceae bacterium]|nr:pitrilysin family protein [Gemmatimonadaceae bacterium]